MKTLSASAIFASTLLLAACNSIEVKSATAPISKSRSNLVIDGKTTKTEIIAMFGQPNGFLPSADNTGGYSPQMMMGNMHSNLMHYKDCTMTEKSRIRIFSAGGSKLREICSVFTALLNKQDIVIAHTYLEDNFITKEKLDSINEKKSSRKDVIRNLGGPSSISTNGNDEIYIYRDCITKSKVVGFWARRNTIDKNCQQTSIIFRKGKNRVRKITFLPFLEDNG